MRETGPQAMPFRLRVRRLATFLFVSSLGLLILHGIGGKFLVAAIYDGPLTPLLGHVLEGRGVHDVDHYVDYYYRLLSPVANLLIAMTAVAALALIWLPRAFRRLTFGFFAVDLLIIVADRLLGALGVRPQGLSVSIDGGFPEVFQYVKEAWIAALFVVLYAETRSRIYIVWSALFSYLLIDDAFLIHENLGIFLGRQFQFPEVMGLRPHDFGEALVLGSVGALISAFLAVTYRRETYAERRTIRGFLALLGILVLFGVGLDIVTAASKSAWVEFLEDAGEMLAVSAMAWYLHRRMDALVAAYRTSMGFAPAIST